MNKAELISAVAAKTNLDGKGAEAAVNAVINTIQETLVAGDKVQINGFGSFEVRHKSGRAGHNPRTGEAMDIPARNAPAFKPGKGLKDAVN